MNLPLIYIPCTIRVGRKSCKIRIFFWFFVGFHGRGEGKKGVGS